MPVSKLDAVERPGLTRRAFLAGATAAGLIAPSRAHAQRLTIPDFTFPKRKLLQRHSEVVMLYVACVENVHAADGFMLQALGWFERRTAAKRRVVEYEGRVDGNLDGLTGKLIPEFQAALTDLPARGSNTPGAASGPLSRFEKSLSALEWQVNHARTGIAHLQGGLAEDAKFMSDLSTVVLDEGGFAAPSGLSAEATAKLASGIAAARTISIDAGMAVTAAANMGQSLSELADALRIVSDQAAGLRRTLAELRSDPANLRSEDYAVLLAEARTFDGRLRSLSGEADTPFPDPFAWTLRPTRVEVIGLERFYRIYREWRSVQHLAYKRLARRCDQFVAQQRRPSRLDLAHLMADTKVLVRTAVLHEDWANKWSDTDSPPHPVVKDLITKSERAIQYAVATGIRVGERSDTHSFAEAIRLLKSAAAALGTAYNFYWNEPVTDPCCTSP